MPGHLCISIHFLCDEFHGRGDQGDPEWPPSPLRLFQAIVLASARLGNTADDALRWLEQQPSPVIQAPRPAAIQPIGYTTYVRDNMGDLEAKSWMKGGDKDISVYRSGKFIHSTFLESQDTFPTVHYLWPLREGTTIPAYAELIAATRAISQFGWGIDLVVADAVILPNQAIFKLSGQKWLPSEKFGGKPLRVPVIGTLVDLKNRYQAYLNRISLHSDVFKPVPSLAQFAVKTYRLESEIAHPPYAVFAIRKPDDRGFASFSPSRRGLHLSGMMRCAASQHDFVTSLGWDKNKVDSFILGHGEGRNESIHKPVNGARLMFIPLPSIEWRGKTKGTCVGAIRRVLVTVKGNIGNDEFNLIVRHLEGRELVDEKSRQTVGFLRRQPKEDGAINKYFSQSCKWVSVTPVVLPGYDDPGKLRRRLNTEKLTHQIKANIIIRLETRIDFLLRKALKQAGFPDVFVQHAQLQWRGAGFIQGTDLASAYAVPAQHRRYRRLHVQILWQNEKGEPLHVSGPFCVGGGRFAGFGLFVSG